MSSNLGSPRNLPKNALLIQNRRENSLENGSSSDGECDYHGFPIEWPQQENIEKWLNLKYYIKIPLFQIKFRAYPQPIKLRQPFSNMALLIYHVGTPYLSICFNEMQDELVVPLEGIKFLRLSKDNRDIIVNLHDDCPKKVGFYCIIEFSMEFSNRNGNINYFSLQYVHHSKGFPDKMHARPTANDPTGGIFDSTNGFIVTSHYCVQTCTIKWVESALKKCKSQEQYNYYEYKVGAKCLEYLVFRRKIAEVGPFRNSQNPVRSYIMKWFKYQLKEAQVEAKYGYRELINNERVWQIAIQKASGQGVRRMKFAFFTPPSHQFIPFNYMGCTATKPDKVNMWNKTEFLCKIVPFDIGITVKRRKWLMVE
ncbi:hypothetical protein G9A89_015264 [Geosiphon pyriformis]|nr:hypothetical protein G9A89_015264 [Geosiphon pyriformis]